MTIQPLITIIVSTLLLSACGGSNSNLDSVSDMSAPALPASNASFISDPIQGTWLLSYNGNYQNIEEETSLKAAFKGKILLPLTKDGDTYYFNDCLSDDLLDMEEWAFTLNNNTLSHAGTFNGTTSIDDGPELPTTSASEGKFELINNNQFSGKITVQRKEGTATENSTFNFSAVKISNASTPATAVEIGFSLNVTNGSVEYTQDEYPLECAHLKYTEANFSGPTGNFLLKVNTATSNFNPDADEASEGNIFSSDFKVSEDPKLNAQQLESKFVENENPINYYAATNCITDELNDCAFIKSHSQNIKMDSPSNLSFTAASEDINNKTFSSELSVSFK